MNQVAGKARLLCLHGYQQNGALFKNKTGALRKALKSRCDCVFIDAPYQITEHGTVAIDTNEVDPGVGVAPPLSWWMLGGDAQRPSDTQEYSGFDKTYDQLVSVLKKEKPDGLLGFSQGASTIGLLLARLKSQDPELLTSIKFTVCVGGFLPKYVPWAEEVKLGVGATMASLHVCGETDKMVDVSRSRSLKDAFVKGQTQGLPVDEYLHPGGHFVPTCTGVFRETLREFVDKAMATKPINDL
eukprot:m.36242 g.36242  ORF g.36242 m.36242 type:complete len:242 (-) comp17304_c0_seq2:61-786(-)